jgi:hypothetical protein
MDENIDKKWPLPRWRRILLGLVLAAMASLIVFMVAGYLAERRFGGEVVKISRAREPLKFDDLQPDVNQGSIENDAGRYYTEVIGRIRPSDLERMRQINIFYRTGVASLPAEQFPANLREIVSQNLITLRPGLEMLDRAAGLPLYSFDIGIQHGRQFCRERLQSSQAAFHMLSLRTLELISRGQDDAAAESLVSMLKMARVFDVHPTTIVTAAKTVCVVTVCDDIRLLLEKCRPSEKSLVNLQKALQETIAANVIEKMFLAERVYQMEVARNFLPDGIVSKFLQQKIPDLPERSSLPTLTFRRLQLRIRSIRYMESMAWLIRSSRRPWPEPLELIGGSAARSDKLIASVTPFIRLAAGTLAVVRCTTVAVAVERYRKASGRLPNCLDDVCPTYMDSVPLDPFSGDNMHYTYDDEGYIVYSVAANRQDDGGDVTAKAGEKGPLDLGFRGLHGKS